MQYEAPTLVVYGTLTELTRASGNDGNDPCRFNDPRNTFKQTGAADLIQGNANLTTCTPTSTSV